MTMTSKICRQVKEEKIAALLVLLEVISIDLISFEIGGYKDKTLVERCA